MRTTRNLFSLTTVLLALFVAMPAPVANAANNGEILFHGHASNQGYGTGFWQSGLTYYNQYFWSYSSDVSASVEFAVCDKLSRHIWMGGLVGLFVEEAYTWRYTTMGSASCSNTSGAASTSVCWLDKEVGESWLDSIDPLYLIMGKREGNFVRIVLSAPEPGIIPPTNPSPGPLWGPSSFELKIWSSSSTVALTKAILIPAGVRTIDLEIDPVDGSVGQLNTWSGLPDYPLSAYFNELPVKYPAWQSILP